MSNPNFPTQSQNDARYATPASVTSAIASQATTDAGQYLANPGIIVVQTLTSAAVQAALNTVPNGGIVQLIKGTYLCTAAITMPADRDVTLEGVGKTGSILQWSSDLGVGTYAISPATINISRQHRVRRLALTGPVTSQTIGTLPSAMDGILQDSNWVLDDIQITQFRAGHCVNGNHNASRNVYAQRNGYGLYYVNGGSTWGDHTYDSCDYTTCAFASVAVANNAFIDGSLFLNSHFGFSPYGMYLESGTRAASGGSYAVNDTVFDSTAFEACGVGMIVDAGFDSTNGASLNGLTFRNCFSSFKDTYLPSGSTREAVFKAWRMDNMQIQNGRSGLAGFGTIYPGTSWFLAGSWTGGGGCRQWDVFDAEAFITASKAANKPLFSPTGAVSDGIRFHGYAEYDIVQFSGTVAVGDVVANYSDSRVPSARRVASGDLPYGVAATGTASGTVGAVAISGRITANITSSVTALQGLKASAAYDGSLTTCLNTDLPFAQALVAGTSGTSIRVLLGARITGTPPVVAAGTPGLPAPSKYGYIGWTVDPINATATATPTSGRIALIEFFADASGSCGHIGYGVATAGATLTSGQNFIGVYDTGQATNGTATLLGQTGDLSTTWTTTGVYSSAMNATFSLVAGQRYFLAILSNGTTPPAFYRSGAGGNVAYGAIGLSNIAIRYGQIVATNTTLPATIAGGNISQGGALYSTVIQV